MGFFDNKKLDRTLMAIFLSVVVVVSTLGGYGVGFSVANEASGGRISQLEGALDDLEHNYWRQVTLSEYLAMETFEFETKAVSGGRGAVLLVDVNRSTYFSYTCLADGIWSCGLTNYNSTSTKNVYLGGGGGVSELTDVCITNLE